MGVTESGHCIPLDNRDELIFELGKACRTIDDSRKRHVLLLKKIFPPLQWQHMIRFTGNFPRAVIENGWFPFERSHNDWLISIADHSEKAARNTEGFGRVLFLHFDDAERPIDGVCITDREAEIIGGFIQDARLAEANVWVNCHAGMCRSGAIVEVLRLLGWQVAESHLSPQRIPNVLVFNKVRRQFPELLNSWEV